MILVIHEKDLEDKECSVIGIADSSEKAKELIDEYYGEHTQTDFRDIRDSNLEFDLKVEVEGKFGGNYYVWTEWFELNKL